MKKIIPVFLIGFACQSHAQNTDSSAFFYNKGLQEKAAKTFLLAHHSFEKAIAYNPVNAEAYIENGLVNKEMHRTDDVKKNFIKALELQPKNKMLIQEMMQLYFDYRQFNEAIALATQCSDCVNTDKVLGISYYHLEDLAQSTKYLSKYLSKNPDDAEAQYAMAQSYQDMEEFKKALPFFEKATSLTGSKPLWSYELGILYYNLNNYKASVTAFDRAITLGYAANSDFYENLGYACIYAGEYQRGEELLLNLWKKKPANTSILRDMAEIFYRQHQYDYSLKYCQQLMEINPKDAKALYQAGLNFIKKNEKDKGQQMCDAAIAMDPSLESLRRKKEMPAGL